MRKSVRISIIGIIIALGLSAIGGLVWWMIPKTDAPELTEVERQELTEQLTVLNSPYEKLLFMSEVGRDASDRTVELLMSSFGADDTATLQKNFLVAHSNYVPTDETWFSIEGQTVFSHAVQANIEDSAIPVGFTQYSVYQAGLVDYPTIGATTNGMNADEPNNNTLAWITYVDNKANIVLFHIQSGEEQILYTAESGIELSQITWSPTGDELAVVENGERIITLDRNGAQLRNPFSIAFTDINYLTWISAHELSAVFTSQPDQPQSFAPKIGIMNLEGDVTEEHALVEKVGVPRVLWSADAKRFLYYNPWKHQFVVYDRYDVLKNIIQINSSGRLVPFGWTLGEEFTTAVSNPFEQIDFQIEDTNGVANEPFDISADEWDRYNAAVRAILSQFDVDFSTYQFSTTDTGIAVNFALAVHEGEDVKVPAERVFIQTVMQLFAVIPNLPAVTLELQNADGTTHLVVTDLRREQAEAVVQQFTQPTLNNLFVITQDAPYGQPTAKTDIPTFNYLGDLYYSIHGDFNPYPALASLGVTIEDTKALSYPKYSTFYPDNWFVNDLSETAGEQYQIGDVVLYSGETEFLSTVSWSGFAVEIRSYEVPDIDVTEWIAVNRAEYQSEDLGFDVRAPFEGRRLVHPFDDSLEYVLAGDHIIYDISLIHDGGVTDEDRQNLEDIVRTFTEQSAFERPSSSDSEGAPEDLPDGLIE